MTQHKLEPTTLTRRAPRTRAARPGAVEQDESTEHRDERDKHTEQEPDTEQEQQESTEPTPSLSSLVTRQLDAPADISTEKVTGLADDVEQQLTALVSDEKIRQAMYTAAASTLVTYIEQGAKLASIKVLASLTRRTRARIQSTLKTRRSACVRSLMSLVSSLDKQHKLHISLLDKEKAKQALERRLDKLADYLLNRLVEDDTESKHAASQEPVNLQIRRKASILLHQYGYIVDDEGLQSVKYVDRRDGETEEVVTSIAKFYVNVTIKRHIYTVPENPKDEKPKEHGVVMVTEFAPLNNRKASQTIEIHRSDMLARQPKFFEQMQVVKPPHKRKRDDFIDALEALGMVAPLENRYNATGLVRPGDTFVLLHPSGGGLTPRGLNKQYQVQFPLSVASRLTSIKYGWQRASTPSERIEDYRTLLKILDIAPGSKGYGAVLLGILAFAAMSQLCDTGGVWAVIHGQTGSKKSATSRLPLQGYAHNFYGRQETSNAIRAMPAPVASPKFLLPVAA